MWLYLRFAPVEAVVFEVLHCRLVALMLGEVSSAVYHVIGFERIADDSLDHFAHSVGHNVPELHRQRFTHSLMVNCHQMDFQCSGTLPQTLESFVSLYLEVGTDLHEQAPCHTDVIGGHHLPLQDGQRNVRARGQIQVCNWWQVHRSWTVCFVITLKLYNFHVGQSL